MYKTFKSKSNKHYLYDSVSNNFFEIDDDTFDVLGKDMGETTELHKLDSALWTEIFGEKAIPIGNNYSTDFHAKSFEIPEVLVIELTQQCNYRCSYCIYSGNYAAERVHSDYCMDESDIDQIIEEYFVGPNMPKHVSFYGGEPLLRFPLIRRLCNYLVDHRLPVGFAITTNGSLLQKPHILDYLMVNGFRLNISYDGLNHDLYRRPIEDGLAANELLDMLQYIKKQDERYFSDNVSLSVTLSPPYRLLENARFFMKSPLLKNMKIGVNTVNEEENTFFEQFDMEQERRQYAEDLKALVDMYIDWEGRVPPFLDALFGRSAIRIEDRSMETVDALYPPGQCNIGRQRRFITAKGDEYMCERVGQYGQLGKVGMTEHNIDARNNLVDAFSDFTSARCKNCYLVRICDMCLAALREGDELASPDKVEEKCLNKRIWFDMIFYAYLSRKEKNLSIG